MNGIQNYENNIERMINNKLEKYPQLNGFINYISIKQTVTNDAHILH